MENTPWKFVKTEDWFGEEFKIIDSNEDVVMLDTPYYPYMTMKEDGWNLVAAAPDLLEVAKEALNFFSMREFESELEDKLTAAIAKAEGN